MDTTFIIPDAKLHESDVKFVKRFCSFMEKLKEDIKVEISDPYEKTFILTVNEPPTLTHQHLKQINMMCSSMKNCVINLKKNILVMDMMKHGNRSRKRQRDIEESCIPDTYDLSMVEKNDKKHVQSILGYFTSMTDLEFTIDIKKNTLNYLVKISEIESVKMKDIVRAFENSTIFLDKASVDFPQSQIVMVIKKLS
jgi:hypothetical protein